MQRRLEPSVPGVQARRILGVSATAPFEEVSAAYHHLARLYHPDKVAALAPEIQALASMRMREINAAYEILKELGDRPPLSTSSV
jgi:DnaJ-class molecular chaperone